MNWTLTVCFVVMLSCVSDDVRTQYQIPSVILQSRAALRAEPWNSTIAAGLAQARAQVIMPADPALAAMLQPEMLWYPGWLLHPLAMIVGYTAYIIVCVAFTQYLRTGCRRTLNVATIAIVPALIPLIGVIVRHERTVYNEMYPPIVIQHDTPLRIGNGESYPTIVQMPKGTEARVTNRRAGWMQIQLGSGVQGWVQNAP